MTTAYERARAVVWAGGFLIELARDQSLPLHIRQRAVWIARHFPTCGEVALSASLTEHGYETALDLARPKEGDDWTSDFQHGPLTSSTRLEWPEK
ncbi:BPSL0761 family protein [uncultured Luteimonas sp.]|uniref:BPSL0761 family protein n=1 Tax=uncultured Luteimonas sp. TaxID=453144 RepID=UPI00262B7D76|nr:BPSL0761 family protein [uncultured Luteimonas sp.]